MLSMAAVLIGAVGWSAIDYRTPESVAASNELLLHKTARSALQRVSLRFEQHYQGTTMGSNARHAEERRHGWYRRDGESVWLRLIHRNDETTWLVRDGRRTSLRIRTAANQSGGGAKIERDSAVPLSHCDPKQYALFSLTRPLSVELAPVEDLIRASRKAGAAMEHDDAGKKWFVIDLEFDVMHAHAPVPHPQIWRYRIWLDPDHGYLVARARRFRDMQDMSKLDCEFRVLKFRAHDQGVWFPEKTVYVVHEDGKKVFEEATTFYEVKVNDKLSAADLRIRFPQGTLVYDYIANGRYRVDENGQQITKTEPLDPELNLAVKIPSEKPHTPGKGPTPTSRSEAASPWVWWLVPSLLLLVVGAILYWRGLASKAS